MARFMKEGGIHEAESASAGADLFLHPDGMTKIEGRLAFSVFFRPLSAGLSRTF